MQSGIVKGIPIGIDDFKDLLISNGYFVDKSVFIKEENIVGECKWQSTKIGISDLEHLKSKIIKAKLSHAYYYMFSKSGFTNELIKLAEKDEYLALIGLDEIEEAF